MTKSYNISDDAMSSEEINDYWYKLLAANGYESTVPPSDYMSSDLTEAHIMLGFWINNGIIVKLPSGDSV